MAMAKRSVWILACLAAALSLAVVAYLDSHRRSSPAEDNTTDPRPRGNALADHRADAKATPGPVATQVDTGTLSEPKVQPAPHRDSAVTVDEQVADARSAMSRRAFDKAADSLRAVLAVTIEPDKRMEIGMMLYECLVRTQAYDEALALGRELLTLSPSPEERLTLNRQLAALLHRMGKANEAEALLSQAMAEEQDPGARTKYEAQLRSVWRHTPGRTDEVVSNLNARVASNPQDEAALRQLGDIYLKSRRDYKAAQPVYEQLAALHPEDQQLQSTLVGIYRENQNYDVVRRVYENRLAQADGDDPTLRFQIAQTELQAGRGDEAVAYAEQHLSGDTATPFQLQMLSTVYDKAGRKDAALATLDTAIVRETNSQQRVSMQFQKAQMLVWNKQYDTAEALLRSIIASAGDDQQTISRAKGEIVRIYEMQGKMSELNL